MAAETARALQPSLVVLEDCDLVAEDRDFGDAGRPLLFDTLDGLSEDADVAFVLTTNRADVLEPALAQRPGRVDLAIEIPLPDREGRLKLFTLYSEKLEFSLECLEDAADATEGITASFAKEAIRRAVVNAAAEGRTALDADLVTAVAELMSDQDQLTAKLLASATEWPQEDLDADPEGLDEGLEPNADEHPLR
ncbi:AAA family ATPase [Nesterenkonia lutea]|uniref:ATP-dependent 26S proteasome regulatory subunit n=1 Tax=Nesterenkonia lutea TaxID=272919 RepID=A0ABR9JGC5_9MICC|nr:AAA family ATPase [Nesterenkonia lutea]MBE1524959.1 ATP-dependent 26S proteasome regulatory subunit [Nesterenkonia lutea]